MGDKIYKFWESLVDFVEENEAVQGLLVLIFVLITILIVLLSVGNSARAEGYATIYLSKPDTVECYTDNKGIYQCEPAYTLQEQVEPIREGLIHDYMYPVIPAVYTRYNKVI